MDDDDDVMDDPQAEGEEEFVEEEEVDGEPEDIDPDELDDEEDAFSEDDEFGGDEFSEDGEEDEEDDEDDDAPAPAARRVAGEDDDEDEDLVNADDVEADLDTILKDRLVAADEAGEDDEEAEVVDDPRGDPGDRLQPKRPDEQQCPSCFLLVRAKAPNCPLGDDACPIFS